MLDVVYILIAIATGILISWAMWNHMRRSKINQVITDGHLLESLTGAPVSSSKSFHYTGQFKIRFNYIDTKKTKTFVLIHGIGASKYCWRHMLDQLSKIGNVLSLDLPGFGESSKHPEYSHDVYSQAKLIHDLIKTKLDSEIILVGSSMGGSITLSMAKHFPEDYKRVVLISPGLAPYRARFLHIPSIFAVSKWLGESLATRNFIKKIVQKTVFDQNLVTDEVIDNYYKYYQGNKEAILCFVKAAQNFTDSSLYKEFENVQAEALLVWGTKDAITPFRHQKRFMKMYPNWQAVVFVDKGHHVQEEAPVELFNEINKFLN